jgi:hypothetical protein
MPKIDKVEGKSSASSSIAASSKGSMDKAVKKAIHDNLKGMSAQELHGTLDAEGMTCFQRIAERKRKHLENPAEFPLGSKFYKDKSIVDGSGWWVVPGVSGRGVVVVSSRR